METQKTIKKEFSLKGTGLQTGKPVTISFFPEKENKGISFKRLDLENSKPIRLSDLSKIDTDRRSRVTSGSSYVETIEHVLAAIWGANIDNLRIEMNASEPPALDGSAVDFLKAIKSAGIEMQNAAKDYIVIKKPIWTEMNDSFLGIFPSDVFKIAYFLDYKNTSIGKQFFSSIVTPENFEKEIAPARTFCLKEEAEILRKKGYGKGANFQNTLIMDKEGPIDNVLRFPDEPVRHKVLDLVGDLSLLGRHIKGRIMAARSGHKLNSELVAKIKETT